MSASGRMLFPEKLQTTAAFQLPFFCCLRCALMKVMKRQNQILGQSGEEAAAEFLKKKGYNILARNWKCKAGELDIVAGKTKGKIFKKIECLVFVEVKTIDAADAKFIGQAEENVNFFKQKHLIAASRYFLMTHKIKPDIPWQIDIIAIEFDRGGGGHKIRHLERAVWSASE